MTKKNEAAFKSLSQALNSMTKDGQMITPLIIISRGNEFIIQTNTKDGKSLSRLSDPNLPLIFGDGIWLLMESDVWVLINELSEVLTDEIQFMDRKTNGWVQVYVPISNRMLNLKLYTYSSAIKLWFLSKFNPRLKQLRSKLQSTIYNSI